ncbi:DNA endonuclease V [Synechococcus phage S-H38]|uniref:DNA endonuclease V n=1 Tax=Synechococcus phage S-H38 TaxID=2783673 RepID=A0A873WS77_9CAUD|nr:DNA endonuclease V [Synechococcus phage S-H38]QPB07924.1 DNA endonuclease V [Synechococcus phage S-H38]
MKTPNNENPPYIVIDGFLSTRYFDMIHEEVLNDNFPWYYRGNITNLDRHDKSEQWNEQAAQKQKYSFGFEHAITDRSGARLSDIYATLTGFYSDLLDLTGARNLAKSRLDMTTICPEGYTHTPHVDLYEPHLASVFYLTDSDGPTTLYDERVYSFESYMNDISFDNLKVLTEVEPKENRLLIFDGELLHTGSSPATHKNRVIINTDLRTT